jgi:hypothetical protein
MRRMREDEKSMEKKKKKKKDQSCERHGNPNEVPIVQKMHGEIVSTSRVSYN